MFSRLKENAQTRKSLTRKTFKHITEAFRFSTIRKRKISRKIFLSPFWAFEIRQMRVIVLAREAIYAPWQTKFQQRRVATRPAGRGNFALCTRLQSNGKIGSRTIRAARHSEDQLSTLSQGGAARLKNAARERRKWKLETWGEITADLVPSITPARK